MITLVCRGCGHEWIQPAIGACPLCHTDAPTVTATRYNDLKRL